jgi:VanZ family protein
MTYKTVLSWAVVIFWMAVIFSLSSQAAEQSDQLSMEIAEIITQVAEKAVPANDIEVVSFNRFVRKNAHFIAYLVLGLLVINAMRCSGFCGYKSVFLALFLCVIYAISDEIHQLYVPGRGCQVKDIIIDSTGVAAGIFLYMMYDKVLRERKMRKRNKRSN